MARREEDILLGTLDVALDRDSDGDGVGDMQERLDGTDPGDAADVRRPVPVIDPLLASDPRGDLEGATLEPETLDPRAATPEGVTIDTALVGMTNLDGSSISTGADHDGIGDDSMLEGRLDANSPLDVSRDITTSSDTFVPTSLKTEPPPGIPGKYDEVSADGGTEFDILRPYDTGTAIVKEKFFGPEKAEKPDAGTVRPAGDTKIEPPAAKPYSPPSTTSTPMPMPAGR